MMPWHLFEQVCWSFVLCTKDNVLAVAGKMDLLTDVDLTVGLCRVWLNKKERRELIVLDCRVRQEHQDQCQVLDPCKVDL